MWERFNRYYLIKQIDNKSSRSVYLAHHVSNVSQQVMLEIFDVVCFTFDQQSENFFQKIEIIKQLKHSSILPILDLGVEQGRRAIASYFPQNDARIFSNRSSSQPALNRLPRRLSLLVVSCCRIDSAKRRNMPRFAGPFPFRTRL